MLYNSLISDVFLKWVEKHSKPDRPALLGISGAQGSGKSALARDLARIFGAAHFSLDDVYETKAKRETLGRDVHKLFASRGVPLTHDLDLAIQTIDKLQLAQDTKVVALPAFDKLRDDRLPVSQWPDYIGKPRAIIVEGWCLGATPIAVSELARPLNNVERDHDPNGAWRSRWNEALAHEYRDFFARFDAIMFLKTPSFDVVLDWRCEQEETLLGVPKNTLATNRRHELIEFIAHFERLTRHMLKGGVAADVCVDLDHNRQIIRVHSL